MENYFKRLFSSSKEGKFVFTTKNLANPTGNGDRIARDRESSTMSNFNTVNEYIRFAESAVIGTSAGVANNLSNQTVRVDPKPPEDVRVEVEPKEVLEEVKNEDIEIDFSNLDNKIEVVEERLRILKEHLKEDHLSDEHRALFFLKNRRKYLDTMKKFPLDWAMTNRAAIDDLCKRYKLQAVPLKQYYTLIPKEGLQEMDRYTKAYKAITGDAPIFELIIKEKEAKPEETQNRVKKDRDPILVANSPLGNFMFVLGAWDEEVEVVDEIIYYGK